MTDANKVLADTIHSIGKVFVAKIPDAMRAMETHLNLIAQNPQNSVPWKALHRDLHSLAGSAGVFGFPELGERARTLEICINDILKLEDGATEQMYREFTQDQQEFMRWVRDKYVTS